MRLATYNVENLFARAKALNLADQTIAAPILERFATLNSMFEEPVYSEQMKADMLQMLGELGIGKTNEGPYAVLRENRGQLIASSKLKGTRILANGRGDWIGWLEMKKDIINEVATRNTAQVVRDVDPDVLAVVECEGRQALREFSHQLLPLVGGAAFDNIMLIDGNDDRGIDVGLMSRRGYHIGWMQSHADDKTTLGEYVFSRDCPEFGVRTPTRETVWVLVNHFKSKGYGNQDASARKRWLQAESVRRIVERLELEKAALIAVVGDLNDTPDGAALAPLLKDSRLKDVFEHKNFDNGGRPGTYGRCAERDKIDYIVLSPALFERVRKGGVWRKGIWGPNKKPLWEVYPEMKQPFHSASDHGCVWCDFEV
ncbi:MAG: endonuclease/exonuclease/phosphatase family protein [Hyphomicrobium sp.]|jgi:endonuclease/exonuclease/phosphatase family metal-dependent hydrolase|nr:endonuclease/exonuclease/phosphatase family protein [Hyphomicrobium sp.]